MGLVALIAAVAVSFARKALHTGSSANASPEDGSMGASPPLGLANSTANPAFVNTSKGCATSGRYLRAVRHGQAQPGGARQWRAHPSNAASERHKARLPAAPGLSGVEEARTPGPTCDVGRTLAPPASTSPAARMRWSTRRQCVGQGHLGGLVRLAPSAARQWRPGRERTELTRPPSQALRPSIRRRLTIRSSCRSRRAWPSSSPPRAPSWSSQRRPFLELRVRSRVRQRRRPTWSCAGAAEPRRPANNRIRFGSLHPLRARFTTPGYPAARASSASPCCAARGRTHQWRGDHSPASERGVEDLGLRVSKRNKRTSQCNCRMGRRGERSAQGRSYVLSWPPPLAHSLPPSPPPNERRNQSRRGSGGGAGTLQSSRRTRPANESLQVYKT